MSDNYYSTKPLGELIRLAESNLKQLKNLNKQIEDLLDSMDHEHTERKANDL